MKTSKKQKKNIMGGSKPTYHIHKYTVVEIEDLENLDRLFECIPDRCVGWFVDESKTCCYWPPSSGKPFSVRAINCEKPDDSWSVYNTKFISGGHCKFKY